MLKISVGLLEPLLAHLSLHHVVKQELLRQHEVVLILANHSRVRLNALLRFEVS